MLSIGSMQCGHLEMRPGNEAIEDYIIHWAVLFYPQIPQIWG